MRKRKPQGLSRDGFREVMNESFGGTHKRFENFNYKMRRGNEAAIYEAGSKAHEGPVVEVRYAHGQWRFRRGEGADTGTYSQQKPEIVKDIKAGYNTYRSLHPPKKQRRRTA